MKIEIDMITQDKILDLISAKPRIILEIGCGPKKINIDAIGIDSLNYPCVDLVGDIFDVLKYFPDNTVDEVSSSHFFEHIFNTEDLLIELARILKNDGDLFITVPHFSNPYFYSDTTHSKFFGLYTMSYFSIDDLHARKVPIYQRKIKYKLNNVTLIFKSPRPFYFRYIIKKLIGLFFNMSNYTKELYEEIFCYIIPCYEVKYHLKKYNNEING